MIHLPYSRFSTCVFCPECRRLRSVRPRMRAALWKKENGNAFIESVPRLNIVQATSLYNDSVPIGFRGIA